MKAIEGRSGGFAKGWRILVCAECGKELATHYAFTKNDPPDWVTF